MSDSNISIMTPCACGSGPSSPNYDCERCRLVYFVRLVGEMRAAQSKYESDFNRSSELLNAKRKLESLADKLVKRFTAQPEDTLFPEDPTGGTYYELGG